MGEAIAPLAPPLGYSTGLFIILTRHKYLHIIIVNLHSIITVFVGKIAILIIHLAIIL